MTSARMRLGRRRPAPGSSCRMSSSPSSPFAGLRHDHVALRVADFDATVRWYVEKLDFSVDQEWPFGELQLAYLSHGSAKIELLAGASPEPQERFAALDASFARERIHHLCLAVDD